MRLDRSEGDQFAIRVRARPVAPRPRAGGPQLDRVRPGRAALSVVVVVMGVLAVLKLGSEFWRLTLSSGENSAIDLRMFYDWVQDWFAGVPVYDGRIRSEYFPASFVILWPALGWLSFGAAKWAWAASTILVLFWSSRVFVKGSLAQSSLERWFVVLMLLSMNATGVTIGNGQLVLHLIPTMVVALLLIADGSGRLCDDLLAGFLLAIALVKPAVSAPFLVMAGLLPRGIRPVLAAGAFYVSLTLIGASFQRGTISSLVRQTVSNAASAASDGGYGNLHAWLTATGLRSWMLAASVVSLALFALWTARHRRDDVWLLMGVTAVVARLWTYHRLYDDALTILPMVCLFRIAKRHDADQAVGRTARVLLGLTLVLMLLPARLSWAPFPWNLPFTAGHVSVWLAALAFFAWQSTSAQCAQTPEAAELTR